MTTSIVTLLEETLRGDASDLHVGVGISPALRKDGDLEYLTDYPAFSPEEVWFMVRELLSEEQLKRVQEHCEMDFSFEMSFSEGRVSRFRGNCFIERGNPSLALRVIPKNVRTLDDLNLPQSLRGVAEHLRGLFLVTGPTGSGKSTTLAALIRHINMSRRCHIITIEDPIEYLHASERSVIHQREIGSDTKSFSEALKRALRQDPDVILVGEMRDLETIGAAVTAAETGHLVFGTLHTPDAPQSIDRIIDVFPPHQQQQVRMQISHILIGICSQQLVPLPSGGRICATELLYATPGVRNCIREGKVGQVKSIMQTSAAAGMHTMDQELARCVREGVFPYEHAQKYAYDRKDLERLVFEMM
jgi:twitching motility protein PilT